MQRLTAKEQFENIENRAVVLKQRHRTLLKETMQSSVTKTIKLKRGGIKTKEKGQGRTWMCKIALYITTQSKQNAQNSILKLANDAGRSSALLSGHLPTSHETLLWQITHPVN